MVITRRHSHSTRRPKKPYPNGKRKTLSEHPLYTTSKNPEAIKEVLQCPVDELDELIEKKKELLERYHRHSVTTKIPVMYQGLFGRRPLEEIVNVVQCTHCGSVILKRMKHFHLKRCLNYHYTNPMNTVVPNSRGLIPFELIYSFLVEENEETESD